MALAAMQSNNGSTLVVKKLITALPFKKSAFCDQVLIMSHLCIFAKRLNTVGASLLK